MTKQTLRYFCAICGNALTQDVNTHPAPRICQTEFTCDKCGDRTHVLFSACPTCGRPYLYFSDLDFAEEVTRLASAYVTLIAKIEESVSECYEKLEVPLPKRWSARVKCQCGTEFSIEVPLPQLG
ncbi:MAG: hypothetical protein HXY34_03540 [Candidatus Thorarchaeota archaeon]|nr:hypothetical protein [Candidatus Thorarchaeota archaeon]